MHNRCYVNYKIYKMEKPMNNQHFIDLISNAFLQARSIDSANGRATALLTLSHRLRATQMRTKTREERIILPQVMAGENLHDALDRIPRCLNQYNKHRDIRDAIERVGSATFKMGASLYIDKAEQKTPSTPMAPK